MFKAILGETLHFMKKTLVRIGANFFVKKFFDYESPFLKGVVFCWGRFYFTNKSIGDINFALNLMLASTTHYFCWLAAQGMLVLCTGTAFCASSLSICPSLSISTHVACCQCVDFGCCTECNKNNESGVSEKLSYILWKSIFKTDASINETAPSNWCNWWRNSFENIDFQRRYDHSSETLVQLCLLQRVLWLCFICHVYSRLHTQSHKKNTKNSDFFIIF